MRGKNASPRGQLQKKKKLKVYKKTFGGLKYEECESWWDEWVLKGLIN